MSENQTVEAGNSLPPPYGSACECQNWASLDPLRTSILTGHHPRCPHGPDRFDAACKLIHELALGIEMWAAEEDGVYPDVWDAYRKAKALEGVFLPDEPNTEGQTRGGSRVV